MRKTTISAIGVFVLDGALQVSGYQNAYLAFVLLIIGIGLLVPQGLDLARRWIGGKKKAPPGFMPMKDAATKLYTEARACKSLWATAAEKMSGHGITSGSPEDILDHMATTIAGKICVYGKRAPSTVFEKISDEDIRNCVFEIGATTLRHILFDTSVYFTDLAVKSNDLNDVIAEMQFQSGYDATKS